MLNRMEFRRFRLREAVAAILLPLAFLLAVRIDSVCCGGESDRDSFYHAIMAESGPEVFAAKQFPSTTMSVWQENFSDKELGFHLLLWSVFRSGGLLGVDNAPPFHLQSAFLMLLLLVAVAVLLLRLGVRGVWRWTMLFAVLSPPLTERLMAIRPHVLAIALFALTTAALCTPALMRGWRKWLTFFLAGLAFGYCYSNPHFVLMPAGAFALAAVIANREWRALLLPVVSLVGVAVALTLHPQFPNSFLIWKIQGLEVVWGMLSPGSGPIGGSELTSGGWDTLKCAPFLLALPLLAAWIVAMRLKSCRRIGRELLFLSILGIGTGIGLCLYFRMAEYGVLALTVALAAWERPLDRRTVVRRVCTAYVVAAVLWSAGYFRQAAKEVWNPYRDLAEWVHARGIPPGSVIGHLSWGDFPQLIYTLPEYRFLCGLDPMFAAGRYREPMLVLEDLRRGVKFTSPDKLQRLIGSRWLWISREGEIAAQRLYLYGYVPVFECPDGWMFKLDEPLHAGKPADVPRLTAPE